MVKKTVYFILLLSFITITQTNLAVSPDASWEENDSKMMISDWKYNSEAVDKKFRDSKVISLQLIVFGDPIPTPSQNFKF